MTIQFKFRSSVGYDSVELDGKPSISVKDLRAKIVQNKSVRLGQDFDLVIANPETGEAYEDENFQVLDGSNVIIMRVPVGEQVTLIVDQGRSFLESTAKPVAKHKNFGTSFGFSRDDIDVNEFDDFGVDLYHVTEPFLSDTEVIDRKNHIESGEADSIAPRCSGSSLIEQILMPSVTNELASGGFLGKYGDKTHVHIEMPNKMFESQYLDEEVETNSPVMLFTNLPPELKCSLCNAIFKDAVMIPCCQHSFCDKCIGFALVEKAQCPKCSSSKCSVKDLLPNVSLRQAIDHFLEAQAFVTGPEKHHRIYVADEESGIHAREVSCDPSILQREPALLHSPSATGKGSNQIAVEFVQQSLSRNKGTSVKSSPSLHKIRQNKVEGEKDGNASFFKSSAEVMQLFGCDKKLPQHVHEGEDGSGNFVSTSRHRKGDRNCYLCGSPNHLLRDCPRPSSSSYGDPMFHGTISAYGTPYCHGGSMTHVKPFASVYGALGMMPFEPRIFPVTPFAIPSYIPSFYPGLAMPYGFMRMGGFSPQMMAKEENCLSHVDFMGNHDDEPKKKLEMDFNIDQEYHDVHTDNSSRDYEYNEQYQRRSAEEKHHSELYSFRSYSGENEIRRSRRKTMDDRQSDYWEPENGSHMSKSKRDRRSICSDKTNSDPYRMPSHSVHHKKEKSRRHHGRSSRRHCENPEVADNSKREETDDKYKLKHHNHSHAGSKRKWKGNDSNHNSKPSKHRVNDEELNDDRWEMVNGPHDDGYDIEDYYQYHKHRRTH